MSGRSTIVVSHNLLTAREATQILVFDQGRIVERGRHHDQLHRGGVYTRLYRLSGLADLEAAESIAPPAAVAAGGGVLHLVSTPVAPVGNREVVAAVAPPAPPPGLLPPTPLQPTPL